MVKTNKSSEELLQDAFQIQQNKIELMLDEKANKKIKSFENQTKRANFIFIALPILFFLLYCISKTFSYEDVFWESYIRTQTTLTIHLVIFFSLIISLWMSIWYFTREKVEQLEHISKLFKARWINDWYVSIESKWDKSWKEDDELIEYFENDIQKLEQFIAKSKDKKPLKKLFWFQFISYILIGILVIVSSLLVFNQKRKTTEVLHQCGFSDKKINTIQSLSKPIRKTIYNTCLTKTETVRQQFLAQNCDITPLSLSVYYDDLSWFEKTLNNAYNRACATQFVLNNKDILNVDISSLGSIWEGSDIEKLQYIFSDKE